MEKILILISIIVWSCRITHASYTIGIHLKQFDNPREELLNGKYCDHGLVYLSECDNRFQICLDFANGTADDYVQCKIKGPFARYLGNRYWEKVDNPFLMDLHSTRWFRAQGALQGEVLMTVHVWDEDSIIKTTYEFVDKLSKMITLYPDRNSQEALQNRQILTMHGKHTRLTVEIVFCNGNWVGPNCDCDVTVSRYHCKNDGSKSCYLGWYGSDCTTLCLPPSADQFYYCSDNGTKVCYKDYYGENCDKHCWATDDTSGHYTCAEDGSKICKKNWCTENCNAPCGESTTPKITYGTTPEIAVRTTTKPTKRTSPRTITETALGQTGAKTKTGETNLIPIIGGVAGLVVLVTAIGLVVFFCKRKQRNQSARTASIPMQSISVEHNYYGTRNDEINHSENLYDDAATVGSMYEDAIAVRPTYDDNVYDAAAGTSNDVYAVPDKKGKKQKRNEYDDMIDSDDMVVMENDVYDSAAEVQQQRAYRSGAASNITDDVLVVDNELYG